MNTYNITFNAYDEYTSITIMETFTSDSESPTQEEIRNAVRGILLSINWSAATVCSITVYKA